jgi:hypothetical protein
MGLDVQQQSINKVYGGELRKYKFKACYIFFSLCIDDREELIWPYTTQSSVLGDTDAQFNVFIPAEALSGARAPLLTYLAGLTCTEDTG